MSDSERPSLLPGYFDAIYAEQADPWGFETSDYEAGKYTRTLAALPRPRYRSAFEIGCSIGVLTARLAERCDLLISIDVAERPLDRARERCRKLSQVRFALMRVPETYPDEHFDLTVLSEVGYYWSRSELVKAQNLIFEHLEPGGHLLLVHWTLYAKDYPLSGDAVHDAFLERPELCHLVNQREPQYRLDLFERR